MILSGPGADAGATPQATPPDSGVRFAVGAGTFVDDIRFSGLLHVRILRSDLPHALIERVDATRALALEGVLGVFTHSDVRASCGPFPVVDLDLPEAKVPPCSPLADGEVCYRGQPVAAAVAESPQAAREAVEKIHVDYEPLPYVLDVESAARQVAPRAHAAIADNVAFRWDLAGGEVDGIFAKADRVFRQRFAIPRTAPHALEPRAAVAQYCPGTGDLTLWTSTRAPHLLRSQLAQALRMRESDVRVIVPDLGGCFGSRRNAYVEDLLVCALARLFAPRPVKWSARGQHGLLATVQGCAQVADVAVAARRDGKLLGIRYEALLDIGAYHQLLPPLLPTQVAKLVTGAYGFSGAQVSVTGVFTNRPPTDGLSGRGASQVTYTVERMVDLVAAGLELDPLELRRINLPRSSPFTTPMGVSFEPGQPERAIDALVEGARLNLLREEQASRRRRGELVGVGVATTYEVCGGGPARWNGRGEWESARVRVGPSGTVEVFTSVASCGQGLESSFSLLVSRVLDIPVEHVRVRWGDTACAPAGMIALGGGAAAVGGAAVYEAARRVERKMRRIAAHLLGVGEDYVQRDGAVFLAEDRSVSFEEVCFQAHRGVTLPWDESPSLEATADFLSSDHALSFGAHLSAVSVDPETGQVRLERHHVVLDTGRVLDPVAVERKLEGGVVRGIGMAILEEIPVEDDDVSWPSGARGYSIVPCGMPPRITCQLVATPTAANPLGARGIGESGATGALSAVSNAVLDALRDLGVQHLDPPLTPERIWKALRDSRAPSSESGDTVGARSAPEGAGGSSGREGGR